MENTYIGAYRIVGTIGQGTFGIVHQAYQPFLDRLVAVKMLHAALLENPKIELQFMNEARTIARLRHPNIVTVYEFGSLPGQQHIQTYMVMEYLPGKTLQDRIKNDSFTLPETVDTIEQLARGLDYAHAHGITHRDLKPANILFTESGEPVIVDFGLAQLSELGRFSDAAFDPNASTMSGTPAYMAPEQFSGDPTGPATDQYALAGYFVRNADPRKPVW